MCVLDKILLQVLFQNTYYNALKSIKSMKKMIE